VLLALAFGLGFVFFGVGTGFGGLNDLWQSFASNSSGQSKSELREEVQKNPNDSEAVTRLAAEYQRDGELKNAVAVLKAYADEHTKDAAVLAQLAAVYRRQSQVFQFQAAQANLDALNADPSAALLPPLQSAKGQPVLAPNPITSDAAQRANARFNKAFANLQGAFSNAVATYKKIAAAEPKSAEAQLQIASVIEQQLQDAPTAVATAQLNDLENAYSRFLALAAPEDPNVPVIRSRLKTLRKQLNASRAAQATAAG